MAKYLEVMHHGEVKISSAKDIYLRSLSHPWDLSFPFQFHKHQSTSLSRKLKPAEEAHKYDKPRTKNVVDNKRDYCIVGKAASYGREFSFRCTAKLNQLRLVYL